MTTLIDCFAHLGLAPEADTRAVRRAYAKALKDIDAETDIEGFQSLRDAYEQALSLCQFREKIEKQEPREEETAGRPEHEEPSANDSFVVEPASTSLLPDTNTQVLTNLAPASHELSSPLESAPPQASHEQLAQVCFAAFIAQLPAWTRHSGIEDVHVMSLCRRALLDALNDPRLDNLEARNHFELLIAQGLTNGWQPGHENLLPVAMSIFGWDKNGRHLEDFGYVGHILNQSIIERLQFDQQPSAERKAYRETIEQLRASSPPSLGELLKHTPIAEWLTLQFPCWFPLIASQAKLQEWKEKEARIPKWQRMLYSGRKTPKPATAQPSVSFPQNSRGLAWFLLIMLIGALRAIFSSTPAHVPTPLPATEAVQLPTTSTMGNLDQLVPPLPPKANVENLAERKRCLVVVAQAKERDSGNVADPRIATPLDQEIVHCSHVGLWPTTPLFKEILSRAEIREILNGIPANTQPVPLEQIQGITTR